MSTLFERVSRLFAAGHAGDPPLLFSDQRLEGTETFRPAAVLAAITERADEPGFLLLHRPSNMRAHPGQIAFPGGKIDHGETPVEAALREHPPQALGARLQAEILTALTNALPVAAQAAAGELSAKVAYEVGGLLEQRLQDEVRRAVADEVARLTAQD